VSGKIFREACRRWRFAIAAGSLLTPLLALGAPLQILRTTTGLPELRRIEWTEVESGYGYTVEVCDSLTPPEWRPAAPIEQWPVSSNHWLAPDENRTVFYRVRADPPSPPPVRPARLTGAAGAGLVTLQWTPVPEAVWYRVSWSANPDVPPESCDWAATAEPWFCLDQPPPGETWFVQVRGIGTGGEGEPVGGIRLGRPTGLEGIADRVRGLERYRIRFEYAGGMWMDAEVDALENRFHSWVGLSATEWPVGEIHQIGDLAVGRRLEFDHWWNIEPQSLAAWLPETAESLLGLPVAVMSEDEQGLWLGYRPEAGQMAEDPEGFWRPILEEVSCCEDEVFLQTLYELSRRYDPQVQVCIDPVLQKIEELRVVSGLGEALLRIEFLPSSDSIPDAPAEAWETELPRIQPSLLLLAVRDLGGWFDIKSHSPWAQMAIDLVKTTETNLPPEQRLYGEVYSSVWASEAFTVQDARAGELPDHAKHHAIVLGAYYEDRTGPMPAFYAQWFASDTAYQTNTAYYWDPAGYYRDYHHYGDGAGLGLQSEWYFFFRGTPPATTMPDDRYYDARDWGYGAPRIDATLNRLTFTEAIRQYNQYSDDGTRRAYLMLGHVMHLLQDEGNTDHARLMAHAGSGMTEEEAFKRYNYCHLLAAEAALIAAAECSWCPLCALGCGAGAYGFVYGACVAAIDPDEMGYEKLIAEKWDISRIEPAINSIGVIKPANYGYDDYFLDFAQHARAEADLLDLDSALGCGTLFVPPVPIPNANPDIQSDDPSETEPYYQLTDKVVTKIVTASAGFLEYFFDIVNYPPIVERVSMVQWEPGVPRGYARFSDDPLECLRYDAGWVDTATGRNLQILQSQPLSLDRPAYVFIVFGPSHLGPEPGGREMDLQATTVHLVGTEPASGNPIDLELALQRAEDSSVGTYYWGSFQPDNCGKDPYQLTIQIRGSDVGPHLQSRAAPGDQLDVDPSSFARAQSDQPPNYPWNGYQLGTDTHHKITVTTPVFEALANPTSAVLPAERDAQAEFLLAVRQKSWDCQWEEFWGPFTCTASWRLVENITLQGRPPVSGPPSDFGLGITLEPDPRLTERATLVVTREGRESTPGVYTISAQYTVGSGSSPRAGWVDVTVDVSGF
jgi:hypothetical protein